MNRIVFVLRGFYACNFAVLGVLIPYWPLYMSNLGYSASVIGWSMFLALMVKVLGPPLWGLLADRGSRNRVIVGTTVASCLTSGLFFCSDSLLLLLAGSLLFSFFRNAQLSLVEATTLEIVNRLGNQCAQLDYGRIRLWGSWGFALLALGLGPIIDIWGVVLIPWAITLLMLVSAAFSLALPEAERCSPLEKSPSLFSLPSVRWFYLTALLMQFSHGAYYGFFSLHLEDHGYSGASIGFYWALGVAAEVVLLRYSSVLLLRFGVSRLLIGSLILAVIRWTLYAIPPIWPILLLGQLLHAFTFGSFHVAAVHRTFEMAPHASRATAQAWYTALSFGLGGGLGALACGYLYDNIGAEALFLLMASSATMAIYTARRASSLFTKEIHCV